MPMILSIFSAALFSVLTMESSDSPASVSIQCCHFWRVISNVSDVTCSFTRLRHSSKTSLPNGKRVRINVGSGGVWLVFAVQGHHQGGGGDQEEGGDGGADADE